MPFTVLSLGDEPTKQENQSVRGNKFTVLSLGDEPVEQGMHDKQQKREFDPLKSLKRIGKGAYKTIAGAAGLPGDILQDIIGENNPLPTAKSIRERFEGELPKLEHGGGVRTAARLGTRATEAALGLPSDIAQGVSSLAKLGIEKATGSQSGIPEKLPLPTSENLREYVTRPIAKKILPKGYLEPQTKNEERLDTLVGDVSSFANPLGALVGIGSLPLKTAAKLAGSGNAASYIAKQFDFGPTGQSVAKMGSGLLVSMMSGKKLDQAKKEMYAKERELAKSVPSVSTNSLKDTLDKIGKEAASGGGSKFDARRKSLVELYEMAQQQFNGNKIPADQIAETRKSVYEFAKDHPSIRPQAYELGRKFNQLAEEAGKDHKSWLRAYKDADSMHRGQLEMNRVSRFIKDKLSHTHAGKTVGSGAVTALLFKLMSEGPIGIAKSLPHLATTGAVGGLALGATDLASKLVTILKHPGVRRHYQNAIAAAAKENAPQMIRQFKLANDEYKKTK